MFVRGLVVCGVFAFASIAQAGAVLDLVPDNSGPYYGGETVQVDFYLSQPVSSDHGLRLIQLDFNNTDSELYSTIALADSHPAAALSFWDFSTQAGCQFVPSLCGTGHNVEDEVGGARPGIISITYSDQNPNPDSQLLLAGDGSQLHVGTLEVTLPAYTGAEATYTLDALNAAETDPNKGGEVRFGFGAGIDEPVTAWRAEFGDVTGGMVGFTVIPEPASLLLLGIGGIAALRRRR